MLVNVLEDETSGGREFHVCDAAQSPTVRRWVEGWCQRWV